MNRKTVLAGVLALDAAVFAQPSMSRASCTPIAHADAVLRPGARVHVGEMHGNAETPRAVGELACLALAQKAPVRVALEIPAEEDAAIGAFVSSSGSPADRAALLGRTFWTAAREQDGRRSQAMFDLLERVRQLHKSGGDIRIVTFDAQAEDRDLAMAEQLIAAIRREPGATFVILSGSLHARRKTGDAPFKPPSLFMAEHVASRGVTLTTLNARYGAGSTWACFGPWACGPAPIGRGPARSLAVMLLPSKDGAFDGLLEVGAPSYSPPAAVPLTQEQLAMAGTITLRREASDAYEDRRFARCGELYGALALRSASSEAPYYAACCWALGGNRDLAFQQLGRAVERGIKDPGMLKGDGDLQSLHADPRWDSLLRRLGK